MNARDAMKQLASEIENKRRKPKMTGRQALNYLVLQARRNYTGPYGYYVRMADVEFEGQQYRIELHSVGRNASHEFSVGLLPDGRLIVRSLCVNSAEDAAEFNIPEVEENVSVCGTAGNAELPTYLGHY